MQVKKRDGRVVEFDKQFIINAIGKAMTSVGVVDPTFPDHATKSVLRRIEGIDTIEIDEIQKHVEQVLMRSRYPSIARHYIQYRHDRDRARDTTNSLTISINELMDQSNDELSTENANKDSRVISTQRDLLAGIVSKHFAKNYIPTNVLQAHNDGVLHYHDQDYSPFFPIFNCMLIDIKGMFENGFKIGNADIEKPKSIATAATVLTQIVAQVASSIYGGNSINGIDEILAPYVTMTHEKNRELAKYFGSNEIERHAMEKTRKDVYNAMQCIEYQINSLHTSNGQTPFCTLGFGLGESWEAALIQESILKVRIKGLGKDGVTPVFPKLVFALKKGHNLDASDKLYYIKQLALECASKRMYPDIISYDQIIKVTGSMKYPMGCRSFLHTWEDSNGNQVTDGRNNLGVVTLNLPRVALDAQGSKTRFMEILEERMALVRDALLSRVHRFDGVRASIAPILYTEGACGIKLKPDDLITKVFDNKRSSVSIGYIGLHEVSEIINFHDEPHVFESKIKQDFLVGVLARMKEIADAWSKQYNLAFSLYGTPSESLCYRFNKIDSKIYDHAILNKGYYTNSFHLSVDYKTNPYDKIDFEKQFIKYSTGGFISYGEYPNMKHNLKALEDVWDYAYKNTPYYGTNTPVDKCFECGFEGEFNATSKGYCCPNCDNHDDSKMNVIRRVSGYLGNPGSRPFNCGKQAEVLLRTKHM